MKKGFSVFVISIAAPFVLGGIIGETQISESNFLFNRGDGTLLALIFAVPTVAISIPLIKSSKKNKKIEMKL
tara:strand:+ start:360 stop:575 length:216 start_codon:yes stop_codon:yes gene_type:complete